ncbi:MAG TPA: DUF523 domain-containing protein [Clostridia bacterium]|nr:DUF523 domain-containing protein [Clostridia bacterium]
MKILVSACLLGVNCRYNAKRIPVSAKMERLSQKHELVPFCPESYSGLATPREPSEIRNGRVYARDGRDVTENFARGAVEALALSQFLGCDCAVLKEKSPSCGSGKVYDGSFSGKLVDGDGFAAAALKRAGIPVYGESRLDELL